LSAAQCASASHRASAAHPSAAHSAEEPTLSPRAAYPGRSARLPTLAGLRWVLLAVVVVVMGIAGGQLLRALPAQAVDRALPATLTVPGPTQRWPWPAQGEAALAIRGLGPVGSFGGESAVPIASLTKMMTAYLVLSDHPLTSATDGPVLTIDAADVADYAAGARSAQSVVRVAVGERLTERQALQAVLVPSANNIARTLARWDAGNVALFVARMNATAARLGMSHTRYAGPSGLGVGSVSTAGDQLLLVQAAMRIPAFAQIVAEPEIRLPVAGRLFNFDYNVGHDGFIGVKTGSDYAAGGCWAFAAHRTVAGRVVVVYGVVLGQRGGTQLLQPALDAGRRLADAVPTVLRRVTVLARGVVVGDLVAPWRPADPLVTGAALTLLARPGQRLTVQVALSVPTRRALPAGSRIGTLTVTGVAGPVQLPVLLAESTPGPTLLWRLTRR